jgi:hypothetical protein
MAKYLPNQLVRCGDHKWAPVAMLCKHLEK